MSVLVTGGAGYIGAHVVRSLLAASRQVVVLDDLSTGDDSLVATLPLLRLDLASTGAVEHVARFSREHGVRSVIHLAAKKSVPDSIDRPEFYYRQNIDGLENLLEAATEVGIRSLVFSSSAAVYGNTHRSHVSENDPLEPVNPYGRTKLIGEWLTRDYAATGRLSAVCLRYFNVAGAASPELADRSIANLATLVLDRVSRALDPIVFGSDYDTPDGTCVRDFVHVEDLAAAHVAALDRLESDPGVSSWSALNVGTGHGASVSEMIRLLTAAAGAPQRVEYASRRPGDPASVVGDISRIAAELGWAPRRSLEEMASSTVAGWRHLALTSPTHRSLPDMSAS